jgi:peptide/nickel transport system permease protein
MSRKPNPTLLAGVAIVALLMLMALAAPWVAPYEPNAISTGNILAAPGWQHWAGTDELGRDILSRVLHGARPSLAVAFGIVAIGVGLGVPIGAFCGLLGGWTDTVTMRTVELVMSLPGLVIALALTAALGPSLVNLAIALGLLSVPFYVRMARGQALALRERAYVKSARVMGASQLFIVRRHMLPNMAASLVVLVSINLSSAVLAASTLSFIGLGAQPPTAEWGALVNAGQTYILEQWWYPLVPGLAVLLAALGFNLLGDGLRDWLDPKDAG